MMFRKNTYCFCVKETNLASVVNGDKYYIYQVLPNEILIRNSITKILEWYPNEWFVTEQEYRDLQIKKIINI